MRYLSFFSLSFSFSLWSAGTAKSTILQVLFFSCLLTIRFGLLAEIRWSVCVSKSSRSLCVSLLLLLLLLFASCSLHRWLVIFHWGLIDSKDPQFTRTLLKILANLNVAVVWMVSIVLLSSNPSSSFPSLSEIFQVHQLLVVLLLPSCSTVFVVRFQGPSICRFFQFFHFHSVVCRNGKIHQFWFFLVN